MKMVNMMGARFSKPLTAKRITHLICYKFEGEKYELAKMVKINIINHQWLEDCLKAWDILPVDNYTARSGWELEIMEAEAKDTEDEAQSADRGSSDSRGIARSIPATEIATRTPADLYGHIPIHGPSVFSGDAEVPAGTQVGNSQQIREVKDASEWSVDVTADTLSTPNTYSVTVSANPDGHTPIHGPTVFTDNADALVPAGRRLETSQQIREVEEVSKRSLDVRANRLSTPNTNVVTISADPDAHAHAPQVDKVEVVAAGSEYDKLVSRTTFEAGPKEIPITAVPGEYGIFPQEVSTLQQIREVEDASERSLDVTADILSTPNTNAVTISANPDGHTPIHGPTVFTGNAEAVVPAGRRLETSQQIREVEDVSERPLDVRADRLSTPNTNVVTISAVPDAHAHAPQVDKVEVVAADSEHDKLVSCTAFEAGPEEILITAVPGEYGIFPRKVSTSNVRNPGAKRSRTPEDEMAAVSVHSNCHFAASESKRGKVLSSGSVEADLEKKCSLNAAESTTFPPEEILSRARNAVAKSPLNANSEMNDAIVVYKAKPANVVMEENPTTSARPTAGKTKRVSFESSFREAVNAEGSTSKVSCSASADNPETCSPSRVLKRRVRKAVAKRRKVSSFQQERSGSEACRTVSVLSEASKLPAESSTNAGKVTVYKGLHNADEAIDQKICKALNLEAARDRKLTITRKTYQPILVSLLNQNMRKNVSSECVAVENNEYVIDDRSMTGGNDDGSSSVWEPEPTWFILTGHRLLRKQCRSILLRLKGRVCSHSHHWSFQATHFITPELRRTEKFFAAAAAGRWILKPEYLFACDEAGKLVDAELVQILINNCRPTLTLNVKLDEPSRYMMETYRRASNRNYSDFYFSYKSKVICPDRTLRSYDICKGCTIDVNIRVRGGGFSFEEYVEAHKHTFTEIAKLPDGNLSLKLPIGGCQFLSSLLSCFTTTWSQNRSWNGQFQWDTHFKVTDGIVEIASRATTVLQSSCMESDIHSLIELLDYAFSNNDIRLSDRRPPYFDHLIQYLRRMKSGVMNPVEKLTIASHPGFMLPHERLMLTISLRRKFKGLSKVEKEKWHDAMEKVNVVWAKDLLNLPLFKDRKAEADKRGEPYEVRMRRPSTSFRLSRDHAMHSLEHRWVNDPNAKPSYKDKQIEEFKDDDGVELMLPLHMKNFLANLIEQLITANIDINRELSSAVVRCSKCTIEPTHPVVAEPIGDDYMPTWMRDLSRAQLSNLMKMKAFGALVPIHQGQRIGKLFKGSQTPRPLENVQAPPQRAINQSSPIPGTLGRPLQNCFQVVGMIVVYKLVNLQAPCHRRVVQMVVSKLNLQTVWHR